MIKRLLFSVVLILPATHASAAKFYRFQSGTSTNKYNLLEGAALNASVGSRTVTINPSGTFTKLNVAVFYTYSAATAVTLTMSCSMDGTNYAGRQTRDISSGAATLSSLVDSKTTSASNQSFMVEYDVRGCEKVKIVLDGTGAGAGDLVNVQATATE
jgi:hypothetical protein